MGQFVRGLSPDFIYALEQLAKKDSWWKDVLADQQLIIGIRKEELDVYWRGQSIFNVGFKGGRVNVTTHIKYLLDPDLSDQVPLKDDGTFPDSFKTIPILSRYEGPSTLNKLKKAADLFSGEEKQGVHAIVLSNENVIDVEISLDAKDLDTDRDAPRLDIAAFEQKPEGIELVFWEAKLFANKELRARDPLEPKVLKQIEEYKKVIKARDSEIASAYSNVAQNLVEIAKMNGSERKVGPAIEAVAGGAALTVSSLPVGLVIFGFDADQKAKDSIGHKHFETLRKELGERLRTRGEAKGLKL